MGGGRLPIAESGIEDLYHKVFRYELAQIVLNIGEHLAGVEVLIGREILIEALVGHLIVGIDHMYAYGVADMCGEGDQRRGLGGGGLGAGSRLCLVVCGWCGARSGAGGVEER